MKKNRKLLLIPLAVLVFGLLLARLREAPAVGNVAPVPPIAGAKSVDVDLTQLSSTMVFAEVYQIVNDPEAYRGKTVKMQGTYVTSTLEGTTRKYHAILISDATACCEQGLEFTFPDKNTSGKPLPKEGDVVTVLGSFSSYKEGENNFFYVKGSVVE